MNESRFHPLFPPLSEDYSDEPGLLGENTGNNPETLKYGYENVSEEESEDAYNSVCDVLNNSERRKAIDLIWNEKYGENPALFWEQESIIFLKTLEAGERVRLLQQASRFLVVCPRDAFWYCQNFPQDIIALAGRFFDNSGPENSLEFKLLALLVDQIEISSPSLFRGARWIGQYRRTHESRKIAVDFVLYPEEYYFVDKIAGINKEASGDYFAVLSEAGKLKLNGGHHFLDTKKMFGESFEKMKAEDKLEFLKLIIASLHNDMVEDETFNSQFTSESVRRLENIQCHNKAHSMLYGTRQPSSTYDQAQEYFGRQMNNTAAIGGFVEEYPFHRMLLGAIHQAVGVVRSIDKDQRDDLDAELKSMTEMLVDLWDKNRNPIFANAIAESLTTLDATYSARLLLDKVKNEKRDKTALAAILYRLEFGQIGISKEGVKYLERMYDLGEYNNPDYFVNRLTPKGEMGIFDGENKLVRFFYLEDFKDENRDDVIHPAVLEFAYDTLFVPKENETAEERAQRLGFLEEFKKSYFDFYDQKFLERTGVRFNNLSFKEQGSFLLFAKSVGESVKEKLYDFCQQNGEKGIRLFLLINQKDFLLGQKLLGMSEMFDNNMLDAVIDKISSILGQLENVTDFVDGDQRLKEAVSMKLPEIQRKIILKALSVVEDVFATASSEGDEDSRANKTLKRLSNINTEAILLGSTLTTVRDIGLESPISLLDNFSETGLYDYEGYEFTSDELAQIRTIYEQNYAKDPEMMEILYAGFLKKIQEQKTEFKVIKQKKKVVAICGFEHLDDGSIYFGKFNIDPAYRGSEIGKEMMENTLDEFARVNLIRADCNVEAPVASNYVERGFVITRAYDDVNAIKSLQIVENTSLNEHFNSKGWTTDYIKEQSVSGETVKLEGGKYLIYSCPTDQVKRAPFSVLESADEDGMRYVATRYLREKSVNADGKIALAYFVFERLNEKELEKYNSKFVMPQVVETRYEIIIV